MSNDLSNATFLDDATGWTGGTSVDETTRGGPGRHVILATGGDVVSASGPAVTAGQMCEVFGHHAATGGPSSLYLKVGGTQTIVPLERANVGEPRRGVPSSFRFSYGRVAAPATGTATLRVIGSGTVMLLKPFLDAAPPTRRQAWQAGPHANVDLDLPAWPTDLPLPDPGSVDGQPVSTRKSFAGDSGVPIMRRMSVTARQMFRAGYELDLEERDRLDAFFRAGHAPFWFLRPDTAQLCRAWWTPEEPSDRGGGVRRQTSIELLLEVA